MSLLIWIYSVDIQLFSFIFGHLTLVHSESESAECNYFLSVIVLTLLHSEWPKLNEVLAIMSAIGLSVKIIF